MKPINKNKQGGLSLIELLISMLLGAVVLAGIFQAFISTKNSSKVLQAKAEIQQNARFAFSVITSIVQEAGNFGCQTSNSLSTNTIVNTTDNTFKPSRAIEGWEALSSASGEPYTTNVGSAVVSTNSSHWVTSDDTEIDSGTSSKKFSDVFKVWYTKKEKSQLSSITGTVLTFSPIDLESGDILAMNDCQSLVFAQVCACEDGSCGGMDTKAKLAPTDCSSPGNKAYNFSNLNIPTTEISVLEAALFFVGKRDNSASNMPALFVRHLSNDATLATKEEILEGVESLQVLYGEDTNGNQSPNYYVSANEVSNWNNIVSLRISLLLRSYKNNIFSTPQSLKFNGAVINTGSSDRYLRRVFTSTISLRNRNIGY